MDTYTHFHFGVADIESRFADGGNGTTRQRDTHRAGHAIDLLAQILQRRQIIAAFGCGTQNLFGRLSPLTFFCR